MSHHIHRSGNGLRRVVSMAIALAMTFTMGVIPAMAADEPAASTAKYVSQGPSVTGTTYYVDAEKGSDTNSGKSAAEAWQTLDKVSATTFKPGDHILLRASSTWNGDSKYNGSEDNFKPSGNTLWPKGNGTPASPIVVDLYELNDKGEAVYEADTRPIINGNGTWGIGKYRTLASAPVFLYNQDGFEFYNLEVTNSTDLSNPEQYKNNADAQRCGILSYSDDQERQFRHLVIKNCYVHDVETEFFNQRMAETPIEGLKATGGIIVLGHYMNPNAQVQVGGSYGGNVGTVQPTSDRGRSRVKYDDVTIEGNYVRRVGLEGIRTKIQSNYTASGNTFNKTMTNVAIRGNYLEDIAGDGIVMTEVVNGVTENNVAKQPCNADYGVQNYAGVWSMFADDLVFQYNEVYGIVYGYNDGEAYDIDMACDNNIYQYNYSHHNGGGFLLFMGDQTNSVVRYNISANDGGGNKGVCADLYKRGTTTPAYNGYTYDTQSLFHYWNKADNANMPTIYNNTFYVGDGISTALYGEGNNSDNTGVISRFYNNIIVKEGEGEVRFLTHYPTNGSKAVECAVGKPAEKFFKNNILPAQMVTEKSGTTIEALESSGNIILAEGEKAGLAIEGNAQLLAALAAQKDDALAVGAGNAQIAEYTSTERLRERTQMFKITDPDSPALAAGMKVEGAPAEDFFGTSLEGKVPDIGAHQASNVTSKTVVKSVAPVAVETEAGFYPVLPKQVSVTFEDINGESRVERTQDVGVVWDTVPAASYAKAGTFTVNGTLTGLAEKATATVTVTGSAGEGKNTTYIPVKEDSFIQAKDANTAYGNKTGSLGNPGASDYLPQRPYGKGFNDNWVLKIKNATDMAYNRRFLVKFDLSGYNGDMSDLKSASIQLHISRYDKYNSSGKTDEARLLNTTRVLDVYAVGNEWTETAVTWNNAPGNDWAQTNHGPLGVKETTDPTYAQYKPVASGEYKNADIIANGHVIDIDVTDYIRSLPADTTEVSFLVDNPYRGSLSGYNVDNGGFDAFSKEGAKAAYDAVKAGTITDYYPTSSESSKTAAVIESETTLAPNLVLSDVYPASVEEVKVETKVGVAPALPGQVTMTNSDGSTKTIAVEWAGIDAAQYAKEGAFEVRGTSNATGMPIIATVTVKADHITGFAELPVVKAPTGTPMNELNLPATVTANVTLADGTTTTKEIKVIQWRDNELAYDSNKTDPQVLIANESDLEIPAGTVLDVTKASVTVQLGTVYSVDISPKAPLAKPGASTQLIARVTANNAAALDMAWTLEGATSAGTAIDENGLLTVGADETAEFIRATATSLVDPSKTSSVDVRVSSEDIPYVIDVIVDAEKYSAIVGESIGLTAKVYALNNASTNVVWSVEGNTSADTKVIPVNALADAATQSAQLVVGEDETAREVIVKATAENNPVYGGAMVGIHRLVSYNITLLPGDGGSLKAEPSKVPQGGDTVVTVAPDAGYEIDRVLVDGSPVTLDGNNQYTIENVTADHTVQATFKKLTYQVSVTAFGHGTVDPSGAVVSYGDSQAFTAKPDEGYGVKSVTANGQPVPVSGNTFTISNVTADVDVTVEFQKVSNDIITDGKGSSLEGPPDSLYDMSLSVNKVTSSAADEAMKEISDHYVIYQGVLTNSDHEVVDLNSAARMTLPIPADYDQAKVAVYDVNGNDLHATVENGKATFTVDKMSVWIVAQKGVTVVPPTPTPTPTPDPVPTPAPDTPDSGNSGSGTLPQTGDYTNMALPAALLALCLAGAACALLAAKRRGEK